MWRSIAVALISCLAASVLPTGVLASDSVVAEVRDGRCHMVISGEKAIFSLEVDNLVPGETILFESVSNGERMVSRAQATPEGTFHATLFAAVRGYETGTDTVTIKASRCTLSAAVPWSINE